MHFWTKEILREKDLGTATLYNKKMMRNDEKSKFSKIIKIDTYEFRTYFHVVVYSK